MVLLLGASSYVGQAFAKALRRRMDAFIPLSRSTFDYARFEFLFDYVRKVRPDLLINAEEKNGMMDCWNDGASWRGNNGISDSRLLSPALPQQSNTTPAHQPISSEESERMAMLQANALLPQTIARVCEATNTPWGHVSSGSIYSGAKIVENGTTRVEEDLALLTARDLFSMHPERFRGFTETDEPNFSFKAAPCTFYSGTKALAEEALRDTRSYIWRLRLPFGEQDDPANFLSQLQDDPNFHDAINSLSHLDDCVSACLELWDRRAPFGTYNIVNPGAVRTDDVVRKIQRILKPARQFRLLVYQNEGNGNGEKTRRSDCILDISKLLKTGVKLRPAEEAIEKSLHKWQPQPARMMQTLS